jgi:hypothetical protein
MNDMQNELIVELSQNGVNVVETDESRFEICDLRFEI